MTENPCLTPVLEPAREDIDQVLRLFAAVQADVEEPLRSMLALALDGGKWIRAALVILIGHLFACALEPFHRLAAAVEMLHAATLVHDDVIDASDLRRGRKTLQTAWPIKVSVLVGDLLLARSTCWIVGLESPLLQSVFGQTLWAICQGEIRQTIQIRGKHRDRSDYYRSIEAKSAALFAGSAEMAGILAACSGEQLRALHEYGQQLGLAFQIVDDVLAIVGSDRELGKPVGSDLRQGLVTLPILCYLEMAADSAGVRAVLNEASDERQVQAALQAIRSSGAIDCCLQVAREHAEKAQNALAGLPDNKARRTMAGLADFVVDRRH